MFSSNNHSIVVHKSYHLLWRHMFMSRGNTDSCCLLWCDALYSGSYLGSPQWVRGSHERFPVRLLCSEWCAVIGSPFWDATPQWCVLNDCDTCQAVVVELQQVVVCCTAHWSGAIFCFVSLICCMTLRQWIVHCVGGLYDFRKVAVCLGYGWTFLGSNISRGEIFFPSKHPTRVWDPPSLLCCGIVVSSPVMKAAGAWDWLFMSVWCWG